MNYRITGLSSIAAAFFAIGIASFRLFSVSIIFGIVYTVCIPPAFLHVLFVYCRRCPHVQTNSCRHVLFGPIVAHLFKQTKPMAYTLTEVIVALTPLTVLIIFPQFWLFQTPVLLLIFWLLLAGAGILVVKGVCPRCKNTSCAMCPGKL